MYFTEKLSYEKDCPIRGKDSVCMGSGCAMWRWKPELNPDWKPDNGMMMMTAGTDYRTKPPPYIDSKTYGYCGMAVRPNFQNV